VSEVFFTTPRLTVRRLEQRDVEPFVAYRSDPEVARYQSWEDYTLEQGQQLVDSMQVLRPGLPGEWYQLGLEDSASGVLVGDLATCVHADEPTTVEVGFTLDRRHQGQGYGTEALTGLLGYVFGTLRMRRVVAVTDAENAAAAALLERVGFRREAHFVENVFFKGAWGSELLFALLEREWPAG
jgi:RimJ/RimL family protein N-acetyltransferase